MLLNKEKWPDFIGKLADKKLWVPQADGDAMRFAPIAEGAALPLEFSNTRVPPKQVVFPQTETLYRFQLGQEEMEQPQLEEEILLLGVRPCDARAMEIVEKLFRWDVDDPYYLKRRALTTVVGLACNEPCVNCFCPSVGGGPASTEGLDLLMIDLGEKYLLEPVTAKGVDLLAAVKEFLDEAGTDAVKQKEQVISASMQKIKRSVDTEGIPKGLPGLWEDSLWQRVSASCLGCGTCTYLCPTCHCFDIQDETEGFEARRCRMWDSCMFKEYTLHTSGHNTRPTRRERTRNRINHKYSYYVDKFDVIACVGCGRCINLCPVNIDIIEVLRQVKEAL
ncbi:MAG TPA: 4Fe-4S dicluster domain-containing protein [Candidatus Limnocylindrales bacterium]|nr:4Fe-4S dicluster domain-containing protein [Candidatus Limnocylindrales bacterium]